MKITLYAEQFGSEFHLSGVTQNQLVFFPVSLDSALSFASVPVSPTSTTRTRSRARTRGRVTLTQIVDILCLVTFPFTCVRTVPHLHTCIIALYVSGNVTFYVQVLLHCSHGYRTRCSAIYIIMYISWCR